MTNQNKYLPQQVPKNHRMDVNESPKEAELNNGFSWQPSDLPMERLESVGQLNEIQWPSNQVLRLEQAPTAVANEWSEQQQQQQQQQVSKWSIAYNQSSTSSGRPTEVAPQYIQNIAPPVIVGAEVADRLDKNSSAIPVFFDDDSDKIHQNKMSATRRTSESDGNVSLNEAQKALEENLALQNKLMALLSKAQSSPQKITSSASFQPSISGSSGVSGGQTNQIANNNLISSRQSDQLMRGILPSASLTVQHPNKRKLSGNYKYRLQVNNNHSNKLPFNQGSASKPVKVAASSFTTSTTTTRLPPILTGFSSRVEPLMVDEEDGETVDGLSASHLLLKPNQLNSPFINQPGLSDGRANFGSSLSEEPANDFEGFYSRQRSVNPSALVGYSTGNGDDFPDGTGLIVDTAMGQQTTPSSYQPSELDSTSVRLRHEPHSLTNSPDYLDNDLSSVRELDDNWLSSASRRPGSYSSTSMQNQRRRPTSAHLQQQQQQRQQQHRNEQNQHPVGRPLQAATRYRSGGSSNHRQEAMLRKQHRPFYESASLFNPVQSASFHEINEGSPSHQVVHIHSKEKKGHGKYLWPIVGGGLTMLMGFLIISNMLLSIPLLAIGASSLFGQGGFGGGGGFHSQQLVPVYNLSQLITTRPPNGKRRRRRRRRWALGLDKPVNQAASSIPAILSQVEAGKMRKSEPKPELSPPNSNKNNITNNIRLSSGPLLEAKIEQLIDELVMSGASRLLKFGGWNRKQLLRAAYCYRPNRIRQ